MVTDGITIAAEFVPQSKSRNAKEKHLSLNWRITISANGRSLTTDYMQGIGHLPGYKHDNKYETRRTAEAAAETGKIHRMLNGDYLSAGRPIPPPQFDDVLQCLILDASAIDAGCFEYWADEFGYDKDSRSAEEIYNACIKTALQLRAMLGEQRLNELRTHYQDR
jgi:hypothetical protein